MCPYDAVTLKKNRTFQGKNFPPAPFVPYEEDRDSGYVSHYKLDRHKASEMSERIFRINVS